MVCSVSLLAGCRSAVWHREKADRNALRNLERIQMEALGRTEALELEPAGEQLRRRLLIDQSLPSRWNPAGETETPDAETSAAAGEGPLLLTPESALQLAAGNSREFQDEKEKLFRVALDLDLEQAAFRRTFSALLSGSYDSDGSADETVRSVHASATPAVKQTFKNGTELSGSIAVDLAKLLTQGTASSFGILADAGISIPLLRGAGRDIAAEPLKQAERNLLYAVYQFERYKRTFAVRVLSDYISVLQSARQIQNAEQNTISLITAARRARRLADAGRLPEFQYDQAVQNELRARTRWIEARESHEARLDRYKMQLGLPPDVALALDPDILQELHERIRFADGAQLETAPDTVPPADAPVVLAVPGEHPQDTLGLTDAQAVDIALDTRLDLRIALLRVEDARRRILVAEDSLRAELTLFGRVQSGARRRTATGDDAQIGLNQLRSHALLTLDLPLNRTAERAVYRRSLMALEAQKRFAAQMEDQVKMDVRNAFRNLRLARENLRIQNEAVRLAQRRVHSTDMLLQAGRAEIRDVLDAQEALIGAQNALTASVVNHRIAELELQRDLDTLDVSAAGVLVELQPWSMTAAEPGSP